MSLNARLEAIATALDASPSLFERATRRYGAVSAWLERGASTVRHEAPTIYPHGSFALGTMTRPISDDAPFDLDLVCELNRHSPSTTQKLTKEDIGREVRAYVSSNGIQARAEEWDKCWTLSYADTDCDFMLDVVPAIPDAIKRQYLLGDPSGYFRNAIGITDRTRTDYTSYGARWKTGNPKGYAKWFRNRMLVTLNEAKVAFANRQDGLVKMAADAVPEDKVKTPLQQAVQLLKRHRDIHFEQHPNLKPASILVTTLAALAYDNEANLHSALCKIIPELRQRVGMGMEIKVINPVDPDENFADALRNDGDKQRAFFGWLAQLEGDWAAINVAPFTSDELLKNRFGERTVSKAWRELGIQPGFGSYALAPAPKAWVNYQELPSHLPIPRSVGLEASYSMTGNWNRFQSGELLPKNAGLRFNATTNILDPFEVHWQVVNTGAEALTSANGRGRIEPAKSAGRGGLIQPERTMYSGTHWIQCHIKKDGRFVASSEPHIVCIR